MCKGLSWEVVGFFLAENLGIAASNVKLKITGVSFQSFKKDKFIFAYVLRQSLSTSDKRKNY